MSEYQDGIRAMQVHIEECLVGRVEPTNPTMQMLLDWRKAEDLTADRVRFIMFKIGNWNPKGNLSRYRTENTMAEFDFERIANDLSSMINITSTPTRKPTGESPECTLPTKQWGLS